MYLVSGLLPPQPGWILSLDFPVSLVGRDTEKLQSDHPALSQRLAEVLGAAGVDGIGAVSGLWLEGTWKPPISRFTEQRQD